MIAIFPEIVHLAMNKEFESLAVAVRKYFAVGQPSQPKLDVESLVRDFGLGVAKADLDFPAILVGDDAKGGFHFTILYSTALSPLEQRFALAHLLGHFLYHIQPLLARGEFQKSGWREDVSPLVRYLSGIGQVPEENLADQFAAALILPRSMIFKAYDKLLDVKLVADVFAVSAGLVTRRLEDLAKIDRPSKVQQRFEENLAKPTVNYKKNMEPYPKQGETHVQSGDIHLQSNLRQAISSERDLSRSSPTSGSSDKGFSQIKKPNSPESETSPSVGHSFSSPRPRPDSVTSSVKHSNETEKSEGLAKLRALARKIDSSVGR